jgi:hypothetical protein
MESIIKAMGSVLETLTAYLNPNSSNRSMRLQKVYVPVQNRKR